MRIHLTSTGPHSPQLLRATASKLGTPDPLLSLPSELRNEVYELALKAQETICIREASSRYAEEPTFLKTAKSIRRESMPIHYRSIPSRWPSAQIRKSRNGRSKSYAPLSTFAVSSLLANSNSCFGGESHAGPADCCLCSKFSERLA